ncbi:MAG: exosome complex RNA-binding protein Csl4 [Promethearchaeia archaeon]
MENTKKKEKIVTTGDFLGVVEEFLPDEKSTYIQDGNIYATKTGKVLIDQKSRKLKVKTFQEDERKTLRIGDTIIGTIVFLRKYSVGLNIFSINDKVQFNSPYFANIHISAVSNQYVEKIRDVFQKTDIIRAKVIKEDCGEYDLSTVGKNYGILHADCSICGDTLQKIGFNKLKCPSCGNIETRKLSGDYGNVSKKLNF